MHHLWKRERVLGGGVNQLRGFVMNRISPVQDGRIYHLSKRRRGKVTSESLKEGDVLRNTKEISHRSGFT